jgi:hypothetical protein
MSDISQNDPYQSPASEAQPLNQTVQGSLLTEQALIYLKDASPWIRFIGILGFIGTGIMLIIGLVIIISGAASGIAVKELSDMAENAGMGTSGMFSSFITAFSGFAGLLYIALAVLYFFPAMFTWNFGTKIRNFIQSNSPGELEKALKNNKGLWKFNSILAIVLLALLPVTLIILAIAAVSV